jgi:hypothetical protein
MLKKKSVHFKNKHHDYNAELELLRGKDINLISDPEGFDIGQLVNSNSNSKDIAHNLKPLIVLGDLLDSATAVTQTANILTMGKLAGYKAFNLKNLETIKTNDNIYTMFGNRDLNKLKLLPLAQTKHNPEHNDYNSNDIDKPVTEIINITYLDLANELNNNINNGKWEWEIEDLKHWYPFWKSYNPETDVKKLWQTGRHSEATKIMTCLERFYLIFGNDNSSGTISAYNLLFCIPYEVLSVNAQFDMEFNMLKDQFDEADVISLKDYKTLIEKCKTMQNGDKLLAELNLAAALVLTVFSRLFIPKGGVCDSIYNKRHPDLRYDGLLYDLYTSPRTYFCAYAKLNDRLLTFSHGGITKHFMDEKYQKKFDAFFSHGILLSDDESITEDTPVSDKFYKIMTRLKGGYMKDKIDNDKGYTDNQIIDTINRFNKKYKNVVRNIINQYISMLSKSINKPINEELHKPSRDFVKLFAMTANFNTCLHQDYNACSDTKPLINSAIYSPILPGIDELRNIENTLLCNNMDLIQFFGHLPKGFGATVDLFKLKNGKKTYNINLDISNTVLSHDTVPDLKKMGENYFYLVYNSNLGNLKANGKLHFSLKTEFNNAEIKNSIVEYEPNYDLLSEDFEDLLTETEKDNNTVYMHGKIKGDNIFLYTEEKPKFTFTPKTKKITGYGFDVNNSGFGFNGGARRKRNTTTSKVSLSHNNLRLGSTRKNKLKKNKTKKNNQSKIHHAKRRI